MKITLPCLFGWNKTFTNVDTILMPFVEAPRRDRWQCLQQSGAHEGASAHPHPSWQERGTRFAFIWKTVLVVTFGTQNSAEAFHVHVHLS